MSSKAAGVGHTRHRICRSTVRWARHPAFLPSCAVAFLPTLEQVAAASPPGPEQMARNGLAFLIFGLLGFVCGVLLRAVSRTILAGLLFLATLALASIMGVSLVEPDWLWQKMMEVLQWLPSVREIIAALLHLQVSPTSGIAFLVGLLVALLGFRSWL